MGALVLVAGLFMLPAGAAQANVSHAFTGTFGSAGSTTVDPYPISEPTDVAVDQATGDVYVTDPGNHRVEKFDSSGHFLFMFGRNVNKTAIEEPAPRNRTSALRPAIRPTNASPPPAANHPAPSKTRCGSRWTTSNSAKATSTSGISATTSSRSSTPPGRSSAAGGRRARRTAPTTPNLPLFGPLFGVAVGGGCATPEEPLTGHCSANGTLYVGGRHYSDNVREYTQGGQWIVDTLHRRRLAEGERRPGIPSSSSAPSARSAKSRRSGRCVPRPGSQGEGSPYQVTTDWPASGFALDPSTEEVYESVETRGDEVEPHGMRIDRYSAGLQSGQRALRTDRHLRRRPPLER